MIKKKAARIASNGLIFIFQDYQTEFIKWKIGKLFRLKQNLTGFEMNGKKREIQN
jgi:hypothetical protein